MTKSVLTTAILLSAFHSVFAQSDFFVSESSLHQQAQNGEITMDMEAGESATVYVYFSTVGPSMSEIDSWVGLDIATTTPGVTRFDAASAFDFDIVLTSFPDITLDTRWGGGYGPKNSKAFPANEVTDEQINGLNAIGLADGIINANNGIGSFLDEGYDTEIDAFLHAQIDFTAVGPGSVSWTFKPGAIGIVNSGQTLNPVFGSITIDVTDNSILYGDIDLDGQVTLLDVSPFVDLILFSTYQIEGDFNGDGIVNALDIAGFRDVLARL